MKITGRMLKTALKKNNITQEKAGEMLGVARQTVGIWMKSDEISEDNIKLIEEKLGVDFSDAIANEPESDNIPPIVKALIKSKDDMIQELKEDKEKLFKLLESKNR